jgi:hypothetical protein
MEKSMNKFEQAKAEIKRQGFHISEHEEDIALLILALIPTLTIFQKELDSITCLFVYRQQDQETEAQREQDGITIYGRKPGTEETMFSIGVSVEALKKGTNYATLVFLHELSHVLYTSITMDCGESVHDIFFHNYLDKLIARYNNVTGESIRNDYFGLNNK